MKVAIRKDTNMKRKWEYIADRLEEEYFDRVSDDDLEEFFDCAISKEQALERCREFDKFLLENYEDEVTKYWVEQYHSLDEKCLSEIADNINSCVACDYQKAVTDHMVPYACESCKFGEKFGRCGEAGSQLIVVTSIFDYIEGL